MVFYLSEIPLYSVGNFSMKYAFKQGSSQKL